MANKTYKTNKQNQKILKIGGLIATALVALIVIFLLNKDGDNVESFQTSETSETSGNVLKILKSEVTDQAKFYPYEVNGINMEVLAFVASDKTIRTALNTCQVCYDSGRGYYVQEGDELVCQNCGNRFKADQVEIIKGGCNPVPIMAENKTDDGTYITISNDFLEQNTYLFANWKK
ncbi:MAG: DUF2318 domain-containing protein [Firmicutes bacterium HGW-Firmicutes-1]|jgi:uncharacterized membrane protein|nr:MAG: DUF2318 domain-containing protein [Firmicutes bacterium HGW-Firmicutes-1]